MSSYISKNLTYEKVRRKVIVDKWARGFFFLVALLSSSSIVFTIIFILVKGLKPFLSSYEVNGVFYSVDFWGFLTGRAWQAGVNGYGAGYVVLNTLYVTFFTILLTAPIGIFSALVIVRMSNKFIGEFLNSVVELLSSIPSVIYGMFGLGVVTKLTKCLSQAFGYQSSGGLGNLTVIIVLTMMSFPSVTMLSCSAMKGVSGTLINGSLALGASKTETDYKVVLTSARGGIFAGLILGVDRSLGEATAVSLVCGNAGTGPNFSIFDITRTLTSTMLSGMSDASGLNYDIRFSAGILLILLIIGVNLLLGFVKRRLERR